MAKARNAKPEQRNIPAHNAESTFPWPGEKPTQLFSSVSKSQLFLSLLFIYLKLPFSPSFKHNILYHD